MGSYVIGVSLRIAFMFTCMVRMCNRCRLNEDFPWTYVHTDQNSMLQSTSVAACARVVASIRAGPHEVALACELYLWAYSIISQNQKGTSVS